MPVRARSRRRRAAADAAADERPPVRALFAYGTLTDERFVARLLERPVAARVAELLDFEHLEPAGFGYPVVFAAEGARVAGKVYRGLSEDDLERIDAYEGVGEALYFRELARVVEPGGEPADGEPAWVYLPTARTVRQFSRPGRGPR
jgi:gamma-glutamylcyclotransferase (GGCT)/AIG2-like uncharacterized protein YtfP